MGALTLLLLLIGVEPRPLFGISRASSTNFPRGFQPSLVVDDFLGEIFANDRAVQRCRADIRRERWPIRENFRIKTVHQLIPLSDHKVGVEGRRRAHSILMGNG